MPQIDEKKLNQYADIVFNRTNYFNDYVLETIARRIKATGKLSAFDQQTLKNMADISGDMKKITKKLAEITEQNIEDIEKIYKQTMSDGVDTYKPLYDFKNMQFEPFERNEFARQLVNHWAKETIGEMINLSRTKALCFDKYNLKGEVIGSVSLEGAFQKAIDDAVIAVSDGTVDFNTAMRETIKQLGGSGVKVHYDSGVNRTLSGMVRQNLLYGVKQSAQAYDKYIGEQIGCDGIEIDYHPHPRPWHEEIGGELYALGDNDVTIKGVTYKSENKPLSNGLSVRKLLAQYGCLHFETAIILGVSRPRYDKEWLKEQKENDKKLIDYNGVKKTKYGWQQVQRRLERATKEQNDIANMAKASGDNILYNDCKTRANAYKAKYDDLCNTVGLEKRYERMVGYSGNSLTEYRNGDILKSIKTQIEVSDVHYVGKINLDIYKDVTPNKIQTDEVIITDERIKHIIERRGQSFYDEYKDRFADIIANPDYIFKDKSDNTAMAAKTFVENNETVNLIIRLVVEGDNEKYKNSIITAIRENDKRFKQRLRNNEYVYNKLDK